MATSRVARLRSHLTVDKNLVPLKMTYFVMYAGAAMLLPYIPLFQKQLGMTTVESGIVNGLMPFIGFLARPMFGMVADKLRRHRLVFMLACLATGLLHLLLIMVPAVERPVPPALNLSVSCGSDRAYLCHTQILDIFSHCVNNKSTKALSFTKCSALCSNPENSPVCFDQTCSSHQTYLDFHLTLRNHDTSGIPYFQSETVLDIPETMETQQQQQQQSSTNTGTNASEYGPRTTTGQNCQPHPLTNLYRQRQEYDGIICGNETTLECQFRCQRLACLTGYVASDHAFKAPFWSFLVIFLFASIAYSPLTNLMDAMAYEQIGEKRHTWGQQRVWGACGFVLLALCSGPILRVAVLSDGESNYAVCFYVFSGFMVLASASAYLMKVPENFCCSNLMKNTCELLRDMSVIVFLAAVFLLGFFFGVINTFLFWFLTELKHENGEEGGERMIIGLALFCASGMELPTIFFSGRIIKKFGERACISAAFLGYAIRFLGYYLIQNAWHVLPFELLHGITFGVMFPAATMYASRISPPGMSATLQGLLSGTHFGFGWGMGALIGGVLYADVGARIMFLACSVTSAVALVVFVLVNVFVIREPVQDKAAVYTVNGDNDVGVQVRDLMSDERETRDMEPRDQETRDLATRDQDGEENIPNGVCPL